MQQSPSIPTEPATITPEDIAAEFNVSLAKARQWCEDGDIEALNVGTARRSVWRSTRSAVDAFRERQSNRAPRSGSHRSRSRRRPSGVGASQSRNLLGI